MPGIVLVVAESSDVNFGGIKSNRDIFLVSYTI